MTRVLVGGILSLVLSAAASAQVPFAPPAFGPPAAAHVVPGSEAGDPAAAATRVAPALTLARTPCDGATTHDLRPAAARVTLSRDCAQHESLRPSRARRARNGFLIGAAAGALVGLLITNDFMDEPLVNAAMGAAAFGLVGAVVGAVLP